MSPVTQGGPTFRLVRGETRAVDAPDLDDDQQRVVAHRGGPLLVLAGPGTGKTTTLVEAVVDRVERDGVDPEHILVLTFSRRAAGELRDRVAARLARTTREPLARTFHSYAYGLLRREAMLLQEPEPRLLSGPEQDLLIRELLAGDVEEFGARAWPAKLRPALLTSGFASELRDLMLRAVERGVGPEELALLGRRERRPDWVAAARFLRQYADVTSLRQPPAYDPAELIRAAVAHLHDDPQLLADERAARQAVFVDEYQDSDPAQVELLQLIAGGGRDLVVVGDPDQSIYAFRGADVAGIREFPEQFRTARGEPAPTVALRVARRFGDELLAASRRVARRLGGPPAHRDLRTTVVDPGKVEVHLLGSASQEATYIAQRLREAHLTEGVPWSSMAVLVRSAAPLPVLRRALQAAGVPVAVRLEELAVVEQPAVWPLLRLLALATGRATLDETLATELVTGPFGGADPLALRRLRQELRRHELATGGGRASVGLLVAAIDDLGGLAALDQASVRPAARVARLLAAARAAVATPGATAEDVLWALWQGSVLADRWSRTAVEGGSAGAAADRDLDAVLALFDAAGRFVDRLPNAGPGVFLDHLLGQQIPADTLAARAPEGDSVTLLTAHAAKGLEWDVVAVAGVQEGVWPDLRLRGSLLASERLVDIVAGREHGPAQRVSAALAEERRLLYVAVTRARRRLLVTAVRGEDSHPSRFLDELVPWAGDEEERPVTRVPRGLDLRSLVAELRAVVCAVPEAIDPLTGAPYTDEVRTQSARHLAALAAEGVRGADPSEWYGLLDLSDVSPVRADDDDVRVSPSKVEALARCGLKWLLEASGGTKGDSSSQGIGSLVHELAAEAATRGLDAADLLALFEERWRTVDVPVGWWGDKQRARAREMVRRLAAYLAARQGRFVAAEQEFEVRLGRAVLTGRVDRLEVDEGGRPLVVDFKTGTRKPPEGELARHPQLGAYQAAVEAGAFDDLVDGMRSSGGAALHQLGNGANASTQWQAPLSADDDPDWARRLVVETADGMSAATFRAIDNSYCGFCPVRSSCPVHPEGRQVSQ